MELQELKQFYLRCLLESWVEMEFNFPSCSSEYLPTKKRKYLENLGSIDEMVKDDTISYDKFNTNVKMLLS
jgi:hypothetical protein